MFICRSGYMKGIYNNLNLSILSQLILVSIGDSSKKETNSGSRNLTIQ